MSSSSGDDKRPSHVLEHLFIGSRAHAKDRRLLKELGINRILNVTPTRTMDPTNGVPNFFERDRSMTYKRVPVFDNRGEDLLQHLDSCISFIEQGSFYGKVLVHCNKGVSRSSTVVAAYLMKTRGLSKAAAMTYLRSRRDIVNPHEGFMAQLEAFGAKLEGERETAIADGQAKQFPGDLLDTAQRTTAQGPAIGPIGPAQGPSAPSRSSATRNTSPARRPVIGPSPRDGSSSPKTGHANRGSTSVSPPRVVHAGPIGPSRGPAPRPPTSKSESPIDAEAEDAASAGAPVLDDDVGVGQPKAAGAPSSGAEGAGQKICSTVNYSTSCAGKATCDESDAVVSSRGGSNRAKRRPDREAEECNGGTIGPKMGPALPAAAQSSQDAANVGTKRARELPTNVGDTASQRSRVAAKGAEDSVR